MGMIFLANAGVPMLFLQMPVLVLMLVPVILIETFLCWKLLPVPKKQVFWGITVANVISTMAGFPILWVALVGIELVVSHGGRAYGLESTWEKIYAVTVQAPWLVPYETDLYWMVPTAGLVLLIPAFFTSVYLERWLCRRAWNYEDRATLNKTFWKIHCASYALLCAVGLCLLAYSMQHKW